MGDKSKNNIEDKSKERESSIELLRILMSVGIVILHYNNTDIGGGLKYVKEGSVNFYFLLFEQTFFTCAVNVFVMISGYFLCITEKRSLSKIFEMIFQVICFNCIYYMYTIFFKDIQFSMRGLLNCFIPQNYYVILYSTLYIISPYINLLMKKLNKIQLQKFVVVNFLLFSLYTTLIDYASKFSGLGFEGLSTVGLYGSSAGYTIVNFVLIYIIGTYIRLGRVIVNKKRIIKYLYGIILLMYSIILVENKIGLGYGTTWYYSNPLVILFASNLVLLFKELKIKNKIINELSKASYTCFLLHGMFLNFYDIESLVNLSLPFLILAQFQMVMFIYLLSYIMFKIYIACSKLVLKLIESICNKLDKILLYDEEMKIYE